MSNAQYLRRVSLVVGTTPGEGIELADLHLKFIVRRGDYMTPNSLDVRIYNPSDATVKAIFNRSTPGNTTPAAVVEGSPELIDIVLSAGYENAQFGMIFQGTIIQVRAGRESQADTFIDIRAADGDSAYNYATINMPIMAGSTPTQQLNAIAQAANVPLGYVPALPATQLPRGKVYYGMVRQAMRDFSQTYGMNLSIQDGQFQGCPLTQFVPGEVVEINSATGMINWPEQTANGIHIRTLLNPNLKIGRVVQVNNQSVLDYQFPLGFTNQIANQLVPRVDADGYYVVWSAEHTGDTRGTAWYTDLICLTGDSTVIPQFLTNKFVTAPVSEAIIVKPFP